MSVASSPKAEDRVAVARRITRGGTGSRNLPGGYLHRLSDPDRQRPAAGCAGHRAGAGNLQKELGVRTILGVSNISFGLPCRPYLNTTFLTMAMYAGLDLAIMNPSSEDMMAAVYAYNVLINRDHQSTKYIERYANRVPASAALAKAAQAVRPATGPSGGEAELSGPLCPADEGRGKGPEG